MSAPPTPLSGIPQLQLRSPADLLAFLPYLLGFHPADSLVVVGFRDRRVVFAARSDLPEQGTAGRLSRELLGVVRRQDPTGIVLVGYGPAGQVRPALAAARATADQCGLPVRDLLRVEAGRWWSDLCHDPRCCPPDGKLIDTTGQVAATCTLAGLAPVADREALAARVGPVGGASQAAVARATARAARALRAQLASLDPSTRADELLRVGRAAVHQAIDRYAAGAVLDDDRLARLSLLLTALPVRDVAWQAISEVEPHLQLWTDVTRRVTPKLVPAPASLLAFTAWRTGDGALAQLALERALAQAPDYTMAQLLLHGLQAGLPPSVLDDWGTPAWRARLPDPPEP